MMLVSWVGSSESTTPQCLPPTGRLCFPTEYLHFPASSETDETGRFVGIAVQNANPTH